MHSHYANGTAGNENMMNDFYNNQNQIPKAGT